MTAEEQLSDQFPLAASTFEIVFDENRKEHPQIASEKKNMKANTMLKPFFLIFVPKQKILISSLIIYIIIYTIARALYKQI